MRRTALEYPRPFWILFWAAYQQRGLGHVWPFLHIYVRQLLQVPLTTVTLLFTSTPVAGLMAMSFGGRRGSLGARGHGVGPGRQLPGAV